MKKKIIFTLLPLLSFLFLACFGNDVDEIKDEVENERTQTESADYITHVPESEFEIEFREKVDEGLQEHIGYSEVVTKERDEVDEMLNLWRWGYRLNSSMTEADYIALDTVLDHENIWYWTEGNDDSINFDMFFNDFDGTIDDLGYGFAGLLEASSEKEYLWTAEFDENEQILWIANLLY